MSYKVSVPGSIMLLGEHAVLQSYPAVVGAISQHIHVELKPRSDNKIRIVSTKMGECKTDINLRCKSRKFRFVLEAIRLFQTKLQKGFDLKITADFPSNLGLGSYPARNFCWEHSMGLGAERHWVFDDNIRQMRRLHKGKRIPCDAKIAIDALEDFTDRYTNIGLSGFEYTYFLMNTYNKPFKYNVHVYSAILIKNNMPYRWRLKYNEDVDLCLQVLHNNLCTVSFTTFCIEKISTVAKLKGGNQDELYKGNDPSKKYLKAKSLEEIWPQYVKTVLKYDRPHHSVVWHKHFKHPLIRRTDLDWEQIKQKKYKIKLTEKKK